MSTVTLERTMPSASRSALREGPSGTRSLITLLFETLVEARAMLHEARRRHPFSVE